MGTFLLIVLIGFAIPFVWALCVVMSSTGKKSV